MAYLIWEANYPGPYTGKQLAQALNYPLLHRREISSDETFATTGQKLGWFNNRFNLRDGIESLRDAYAAGELINPSQAAIQEAFQWIRYESGAIGPAQLQEESPEARATHGDRVIADMLLTLAMAIDLPAPKKPRKGAHWTEERLRWMKEKPDDPEDDFGGELIA